MNRLDTKQARTVEELANALCEFEKALHSPGEDYGIAFWGEKIMMYQDALGCTVYDRGMLVETIGNARVRYVAATLYVAA